MVVLDFFRGILLGAVDWMNILLRPFDYFKREPEVVDYAPLAVMDEMAWRDIQNNWLFGPEKEFYWHMNPNDCGDMAMWHGMYVGACAFRNDMPALEKALDGLERLQYLGGNSRLARGAGEIGGPQNIDPSRKYYTDGAYVFTDNCSESSLIGYLFGIWSVYRTIGDHAVEIRVAKMVNDLARQVYVDGEVLRNQDGAEAKFGHLKPGLFTAPIRISALACLYLMADVLGRELPEDERFSEAGSLYAVILKNHSGALTHPETHFLWIHPWYQDILAYIVLGIQATMASPEKRGMFRSAMRMQMRKNDREGNSFYAYMYCFACDDLPYALMDNAAQTLREFNITSGLAMSCKRPHKVNNSETGTPTLRWGLWSRRQTYARQPVPVYRRPPQDIVWQRCPYSPDGEESYRYNSMDFSLAYSMGKYLHMLP